MFRERYMEALMVQLEFELQRFDVSADNLIESIFIGGGTPSTVDPQLYQPIFEKVRPYLIANAEITSEANPNSATRSWLEGMFKLGVNRISFGVQSFDDEKLRRLGRAHNTAHALRSIQDASYIGFKHISVDLIYGVQGDDKLLIQSDLDRAFALPIDHISLYALTIEPHTLFEEKPHMADENLEETRWIFNYATSHGFPQYEISNFGQYHSYHNMGYWKHTPYIGIGSGAVGFEGKKRLYPSTDVEAYIKSPLSLRTEELSDNDVLSEKLFLGLRSCIGVDRTVLNDQQMKMAMYLVEENFLRFENGTFYNNDFLLADEIALKIEGY